MNAAQVTVLAGTIAIIVGAVLLDTFSMHCITGWTVAGLGIFTVALGPMATDL